MSSTLNIDTNIPMSVREFNNPQIHSFVCAVCVSGVSLEQFIEGIRAVLSTMSAHLERIDEETMDKFIASALKDKQGRRPVTRESIKENLHSRRDAVYTPVEQCVIIADPPVKSSEPALVGAGIISIGEQNKNEKHPPLMFSIYPTKPFSRIRTIEHYVNTVNAGVIFYAIAAYMEWLHLDDGDGCHASVQVNSLPWGVHEYARMLGQGIAQGAYDDAFSSDARGLLWYCKCESWTEEFLHQVNDYVIFSDSEIPRVKTVYDMTKGLVEDISYEKRHDEKACRRAYYELELLSPIWRSIANRASTAGETASVADTFVKYGGPEMLQAAKDGVPVEDVIA